MPEWILVNNPPSHYALQIKIHDRYCTNRRPFIFVSAYWSIGTRRKSTSWLPLFSWQAALLLFCSRWEFEAAANCNCNLDEKKPHKNICCAGALRLMGIVPAQHAKETGPNTLHFTVNLESIFWGIDVLKGTSGLWHEMNCVLGESTSWAWCSQNKIPKNLQRLGIWHAANLTA